jgi:long-chain fatty acid transport protein
MKFLARLSLVFVLMVALSTGLFSNGLNVNGSGTKAISMGGAFVGLADDYSAIYWNPAGLTQIKNTTLALFVTDIIPKQSYTFSLLGIDAKGETNHNISGGLGFIKPLSDKVVAGVYAYVPSGISSEWDGNDLALLSDGIPMIWKSKLGIITVSPAIAVKLSDTFSFGLTVNLNYGMLELERPALGQYQEDLTGTGIGATLGMLFKPNEKFSIGLTYKTPFKAKLSGDAGMSGAPLLTLPATDDAEREVTLPQWIAAGLCFKPNDQLTFTVDVQHTNWKKIDTIPMSFTDPGWQLFFEPGTELHFYWKNGTQVRFGVEYKLSDSLALRGGYYYDPGVGPKRTQTILVPQATYNFITLGFGYKSEKIILDFCFEYGMGKDVDVGLTDAMADVGMPGVHGVDLLVPNVALTILL